MSLRDSGTGSSTSASTVTAGINPAGDNRELLLFIVASDAAGAPGTISATLGAVNVPDERWNLIPDGYNRQVCLTLDDPATGEQTVTVTSTTTEDGMAVVVVSEDDRGTPENVVTDTGTGNEEGGVTVTSETGAIVYTALNIDGGTNLATNQGETLIALIENIATYGEDLIVHSKAGAASVVTGCTWDNYAHFATGGFSLPADVGGGGGSAVPKIYQLMTA